MSAEWSTGLCNCSPCGTCCLATFLPCVLLGQTSQRMKNPKEDVDCCSGDCWLFCGISCLTGCGWIYVMLKRGDIRDRYGMQRNGCGDCCTAYWCSCCALIQQDNEVRAHSTGPVMTGYQQNQGMYMPSR